LQGQTHSAIDELTQALQAWILGLPCWLPRSSVSICHAAGSRGHPQHQGASLGIQARTAVVASLRAGDHQHAQRAILGRLGGTIGAFAAAS
jgi:hypothetical protein